MRKFRIKANLRVSAELEKDIVAEDAEAALEAFDDFTDTADDSDFEILWEHTDWLGKPEIKDLGEHIEIHEKQGRLKL